MKYRIFEAEAEAIAAESEVSSRNSITPATPANVTDAQAAIIAEVDASETKIDDVKAKTDLIPALL